MVMVLSMFFRRLRVALVTLCLFSAVRSARYDKREEPNTTTTNNMIATRMLYLCRISCCILALYKIFLGNEQEQANDAGEINDIPQINHTTADTAVMKIDAEHFNIIISSACKQRQFTE